MSTRLEWSHTLTGADGQPKRMTWAEAEAACAALGEGRRLPTRAELSSIIDDTRHKPAIDTSVFPDTQSAYYWTGTPAAWSPSGYAWIVNFYHGYADHLHRLNVAFVRAVRSVPAACATAAPEAVTGKPEPTVSDEAVEAGARALCASRGLCADALHDGAGGSFPADAHRYGYDSVTLIPQYRGWRKQAIHARAVLLAAFPVMAARVAELEAYNAQLIHERDEHAAAVERTERAANIAEREAEGLRADAQRLEYFATHLQREAQVMLSDGVRDCWAWAISSATPDLRAAIDAARSAAGVGDKPT